MAKFEKEILTEGLYVTGDGKGGRQVSYVPKKRIQHWASQHKKMVEAGLKIPAPEMHADDENPNKYAVAIGSKSNFGFWDQLSLGEVEKDGELLTTLNGVLDVPVDEDADRIGTSVQETSVYVKDKFVDGTGKVWEDVLVHIAPCTKPIEPGQKNFSRIEQGDLSIAMSMSHRLPISMAEMGSVNDMLESDIAPSNDLKEMLMTVVGIAIPDNCSMDQLESVLLAALRQKQLSEQSGEGGSVTKPPKDSVISQVPIVMSSNTNQGASQAAPQVKTKSQQSSGSGVGGGSSVEVIPPDTKTTAMSQLETQNAGLINVVTDQSKKSLMNRLHTLRQRGIVSTDEQFKQLESEITGITSMSFNSETNKPNKEVVEIKIEALESVSIPMPANSPTIAMASADDNGNYVIHNNPLPKGSNQQMTAERSQSIVDGLFGSTSNN